MILDTMVWSTARGRVTLYLPRDVDEVEIDEIERVVALQLKTWARIMREKIAASQDAPVRKAGDRIAEVDETRQPVEKGRALSDERKTRPTQLPEDSASGDVTAAVCDERKTSPGATPADAAPLPQNSPTKGE